MQLAAQAIRNEIAKLEAHKTTVQHRIQELHDALGLIERPISLSGKKNDGSNAAQLMLGGSREHPDDDSDKD